MTVARLLQTLHWLGPAVALAVIVGFWGETPGIFGAIVITVVLIGGVISAVAHVDRIAAYLGRVFGAIVLALAVTIIEVALIVSIILTSPGEVAGLGRDTVFAAVMITTNGIVGFSVVAATRRSATSSFNSEGSGAALGAIATIATLSLVLPTFTTGSAGPTFTIPQLIFVATASLGVYSLFLYVLTVRNREHFEDADSPPTALLFSAPTRGQFAVSTVLLVVSLAAVVGLAWVLAPSVGAVVGAAGLPFAFVGVVIALVILLPEGSAAIRFATRGSLQSSFNIAYGSALASIGLTIPTLAALSVLWDIPMEFGLRPVDIVLLALTLLVSAVTVSSHRVTLFQGGLHVAIFSAYIFLSASP